MDRIKWGLFGTHDRAFGPCLPAMHRILHPVVRCLGWRVVQQSEEGGHEHCPVCAQDLAAIDATSRQTDRPGPSEKQPKAEEGTEPGGHMVFLGPVGRRVVITPDVDQLLRCARVCEEQRNEGAEQMPPQVCRRLSLRRGTLDMLLTRQRPAGQS
jgi:hypothetical protein